MTGDCTYHPVSRFLAGWLLHVLLIWHQHTLINLEDHREESHCELFRPFWIRCSGCFWSQAVDRLHKIRDQKYVYRRPLWMDWW